MGTYTVLLEEMPSAVRQQLLMWTAARPKRRRHGELQGASRRGLLAHLLGDNLDFRGENTSYSRHNFHAFAAKFPPQLPKFFIGALSEPGELVLDPMMGSGTAVLEAVLEGRRAAGFDLDPLAVRLSRIKTLAVPTERVFLHSRRVIQTAREALGNPSKLDEEIASTFDEATKAFIDYWFLPATQRELYALRKSIQTVADTAVRAFLDVAFSAIIVTKSGGVSLAMDLAHSRPHKVARKAPRDALLEFEKRIRKNLSGLAPGIPAADVQLHRADARALPLADDTVDLIVTSPPYANAIDYVRAHKFSLVWLGTPIDVLASLRSTYIGSERVGDIPASSFGPVSDGVLRELSAKDVKKSRVLSRYFRDMFDVLKEMYRVTRNNRCAVVVVGSSTMRGIDVQTPAGLAEAAEQAGWDVVGIGTRRIDRDKRMMPMRARGVAKTGIEERMSEEAVIGLFKN